MIFFTVFFAITTILLFVEVNKMDRAITLALEYFLVECKCPLPTAEQLTACCQRIQAREQIRRK